MKKKIDLFWYWFIFVVAFVLCFFAINNKKINAYHLNENGNLVSDNLINLCDYNNYSSNGINTTINDDCTLSIVGTATNVWASLSTRMSLELEPGDYSFAISSPQDITFTIRIYYANDSDVFYIMSGRTLVNITLQEDGVAHILGVDYMTRGQSYNVQNVGISIIEGHNQSYEPYGVWYGESFVGDLATGVISYSSASLTYDNRDYGTSHSIADVSSYIDSSFGYLYFDRLWQYLDTLTSSEYENAWLTLQLNNKMNLNTTYILNAMFNNGNYGVGAKFYQGNNLILDVTNWVNNNYTYCSETSGATCSVQLSNFVNVGDRPDLQNSFTYFDKIEIWSGDTDKRTGSFGFQNISYNQGYNSGYNIGYSTGNSNGEKTGYNKGYNNGYLYGYEKGVDAVEGTDNTLVGLVGGILTAPVNMLKTIFDFEFLGINLTHFIFSIVSLFIVIWLIKVFL